METSHCCYEIMQRCNVCHKI